MCVASKKGYKTTPLSILVKRSFSPSITITTTLILVLSIPHRNILSSGYRIFISVIYADFIIRSSRDFESVYPYRRRAARPAAAMRPGMAVCMGAAFLEEAVEDAPDAAAEALERAPEALERAPETAEVAAELMDEANEEASEESDDASLEREDAPEAPAVAIEVKSVERSEVKVEPSETMVEAMVEMAERPAVASEVEKIVVLPIVVSPVLLPLVIVETRADVVIGMGPP